MYTSCCIHSNVYKLLQTNSCIQAAADRCMLLQTDGFKCLKKDIFECLQTDFQNLKKNTRLLKKVAYFRRNA